MMAKCRLCVLLNDHFHLGEVFSHLYFLVTSRVSSRGNRIGAVFLSVHVCVCVSVCQSVNTLTAKSFDLRP